MNRKEFLVKCSSCLPLVLAGCASSRIVAASMMGSDIVFPAAEFEFLKKDQVQFRKYIVVENEKLEYPICVYRQSETSYSALWMKCTHQGTELQAFGDKLHCPAHGSEFNKQGGVENGPASNPLRTFPVTVSDGQLRISLK